MKSLSETFKLEPYLFIKKILQTNILFKNTSTRKHENRIKVQNTSYRIKNPLHRINNQETGKRRIAQWKKYNNQNRKMFTAKPAKRARLVKNSKEANSSPANSRHKKYQQQTTAEINAQ